ncbi:hypothetical protein [Vibrio aerogenes]|uniref:hypothetical protein n=1 Tax=Vibrio aerogenes TaxID=92172 RepID=UPI0039EEDD08
MSNQREKLCYEAGVDAIRHIIEVRKRKGRKKFDRLDEDKKVPFVVPKVTWDYKTKSGYLNNEHWAFKVSYAFREALDLRCIERVRKKQKVNLWSQGPLIAFKEGDLLLSRCESKAIQVKYANPMGWDTPKNEMYYGSVIFKIYTINNGSFDFITEGNATQLEFLEMMINGLADEVKNDSI